MPATIQEVADALRDYKQKNALSDEAIARRADASLSTVRRWLQGKHAVQEDKHAEWMRKNIKIDPPRPASAAAAKVEISERLARLEAEAVTRDEMEASLRRIEELLRRLADRDHPEGASPSG